MKLYIHVVVRMGDTDMGGPIPKVYPTFNRETAHALVATSGGDVKAFEIDDRAILDAIIARGKRRTAQRERIVSLFELIFGEKR